MNFFSFWFFYCASMPKTIFFGKKPTPLFNIYMYFYFIFLPFSFSLRKYAKRFSLAKTNHFFK